MLKKNSFYLNLLVSTFTLLLFGVTALFCWIKICVIPKLQNQKYTRFKTFKIYIFSSKKGWSITFLDFISQIWVNRKDKWVFSHKELAMKWSPVILLGDYTVLACNEGEVGAMCELSMYVHLFDIGPKIIMYNSLLFDFLKQALFKLLIVCLFS